MSHRKVFLFIAFALMAFMSFHAFGAGGRTVTIQHVVNAAPANINHTSSATGDSHTLGYPSDMGLAVMGSVQCDWTSLTGTINATAQVNVSDDGGANWNAKSGGTITLSGASGTGYVAFAQTPEQLYQVVYTAGGVTGGTVDCYLVGK